MNNSLFWLTSLLACLAFNTTGLAQIEIGRRIYVDADSKAGSESDGSSWNTAFLSLQDALKKAQKNDTIWVADGTYFPSNNEDINISFRVPNGVSIYGGFQGNELRLWERLPDKYLSILSGKLTASKNTKSVILLSDVDSTTVLDGIVVEGGYAISNQEGHGAGIKIVHTNNAICNPRINNCLIRENRASIGAGIYISIKGDARYSIKITNCVFQKNFASNGAGLYLSNSNQNVFLNLDHCLFNQNNASFFASSIYYFGIGNMIIKNCSFQENENLGSASVAWVNLIGDLTIDKCSFYKEKNRIGGSILIMSGGTEFSTKQKISITNTSFEQNSGSEETGISVELFENNSSILLIQNCTFNASISDKGGNTIKFLVSGSKVNFQFMVDKCYFSNNRATRGQYGVVHFLDYSNSTGVVNGKITNCSFYKNNGGISINNGGQGIAKLSILNSTFFKNLSPSVSYSAASLEVEPRIILQNSIFSESSSSLSAILKNTGQSNQRIFSFNHCLFSAPSCSTTSDTTGCGVGNIFGQYPKFVDSSSVSGLTLAPGSVAINAGRWYPELGALDLAGRPRVQDCKVDLGAYESPSLLSSNDTLAVKAQIRGTATNQALGSIGIQQISGGLPPYRIRWENGDSARVRNALPPGQYTLTLTDKLGCFKIYTYTVPLSTSLKDIKAPKGQIQVAPNPLGKGQAPKLYYTGISSGQWQLQVMDLSGRALHRQVYTLQAEGNLDLPAQLELPAGLYVLMLRRNEVLLSTKLVVTEK